MTRQALVAVFNGPGKPLELRTVTVADPVGEEILVRVTGSTLCGSDLHTYEGRRDAPKPSILGHEILGTIEVFGPEANRRDLAGQPLNEGDRITWSVIAQCGKCYYCMRGLLQKCERMMKYGHEPLDRGLRGGLAEYCLLAPGSAVLKIPDTLSDRVACPASCATATSAAGIRAAGEVQGRVVLVQGAGMLGLTTCAMAAAAGAAEVICSDVVAERLARSEAFGATRTTLPPGLPETVASVTRGQGVDVAIELTGTPAAFEEGLPMLRLGGTYVLIGAVYPSRPISLGMETLVRRHLTLRGIHNYAPEDLKRAIEFLAVSPNRPFESLVEGWYPLTRADEAFNIARKGTAFRVGVRPDSELTDGG